MKLPEYWPASGQTIDNALWFAGLSRLEHCRLIFIRRMVLAGLISDAR